MVRLVETIFSNLEVATLDKRGVTVIKKMLAISTKVKN